MLVPRPWRTALAAATLLSLSLAAVASTLVGNPKFLPGLLSVPAGVDMPLADIVLDDCQGGGPTLDVDMDLTDPFAVTLPGGTWCAISVVFEDAIEVE